MTSRIRITAAATAAVFALSACSSADVAANVGGTDITDGEVIALRSAGVGPTADGGQFRGDLTTLIIGRATLLAAEEDFGITGLESPEAREAWLAQATPQELDVVANVAANPALTDAAVEVVTTQLMVRDAVIDAIATDEELLLRVWQERQQELIEVCPIHILVATEEEAAEARARVLAGEDFASLADEVSLDTSSPGGALPCPSIPVAYVEPFATVVATAPVGEVTEPFETQFGWHIVVVESREVPASYDEYVSESQRWIPADALAGEWTIWRDDAVERAVVLVRSQIGRWFPEGDGILPPPTSP
jgi:hypothetical protein